MFLARVAALAAFLVAANAAVGPASAATFLPRPTPEQARTGLVRIWVRNVVFYPYRDAPTHVLALAGTVAPTRSGRTISFDDIRSYGVMIEHADVAMSAATMTVLMNRYVLPASNGPIKRVQVTFGNGTIALTGTMVKGAIRAKFKATAVPSVTPDGNMRIRITKLVAGGFVTKGLLHAVGLKMEKVAQPRNTAVFHVVGDDMIIPVVSIFPPPKFSGVLRAVRVTPNAIVSTIGTAVPPAMPALGPSYMHYRGGVIMFAKLTMRDVDMTLVPKAPGTTLGFSGAAYYLQLENGFSVLTPQRALIAHVPDYATLRRKP